MSDVKTEKVKLSYKEKKKLVSKIANPLAGKSLTKKCLKVVTKRMPFAFLFCVSFARVAKTIVPAVSKTKHALRRGVKEVTKAIRKGEKGYELMLVVDWIAV
jgi:hypothetical protein